jgi:hypothetical protein
MSPARRSLIVSTAVLLAASTTFTLGPSAGTDEGAVPQPGDGAFVVAEGWTQPSPVSFSRRAASASSEARVPVASPSVSSGTDE